MSHCVPITYDMMGASGSSLYAARSACCLIIDQGPINLNHFVILEGRELRGAVSPSVDQVLIRGLLAQGHFNQGRDLTAGGLQSELPLGSSGALV